MEARHSGRDRGTHAWTGALLFALGAIVGMLSGRLFARRVAGARLQQGFALLTPAAAISVAAKALAH